MKIENHVTISVALNAARREYLRLWVEAYGLGMTSLVTMWAKDIERVNDAQAELEARQYGTPMPMPEVGAVVSALSRSLNGGAR